MQGFNGCGYFASTTSSDKIRDLIERHQQVFRYAEAGPRVLH